MAKKEHNLFMVYTTQISLFQGCLYDSINHKILSKTFPENWDSKAPSVGTLLAYLETMA